MHKLRKLPVSGSGQEFENDIFVILYTLFKIADIDIFIWLVAKLGFARPKDDNGCTQ